MNTGGSEDNRARFALKVPRAVRRETGADFPVLIRLSVDELGEGRVRHDFHHSLYRVEIVEAGADAIHASVGVIDAG